MANVRPVINTAHTFFSGNDRVINKPVEDDGDTQLRRIAQHRLERGFRHGKRGKNKDAARIALAVIDIGGQIIGADVEHFAHTTVLQTIDGAGRDIWIKIKVLLQQLQTRLKVFTNHLRLFQQIIYQCAVSGRTGDLIGMNLGCETTHSENYKAQQFLFLQKR